MKLTIQQHFRGIDVEAFAEMYFSDAFNHDVAGVAGLKSRTIEAVEPLADGTVKRRMRLVPAIELPAPIKKLTKNVDIAWDEITIYDPHTHTAQFWVESPAGSKVDIRGTIAFVGDATGVSRTIDGELRIQAPLGLGLIIERFIAEQSKSGYERIASFMQARIDSSR